MAWPPRSPDLNPLDFFFWGFVNQQVYNSRIFHSTSELKQAIIQEIDNIPPEMIQKAISSIPKRLQCVIDSNGQIIKK
jgi:hypothetical protein